MSPRRLSLRHQARAFLAAAAVLIATSAVTPAWAGPALDAVKAKQTELFKLLGQPSSADTQKKIGAIFDEMLDYAPAGDTTPL